MARDRASRPEAAPARLFVAIEIDEAAKSRVRAVLEPWRQRFPAARWAPPANWHVTLVFLGRTWPRLMGWVQEQAAGVARASSPFTVTLDGLGAFPSTGRARVVWAGLRDPDGSCASMAQKLGEALSREFEPDKRAFHPHVTVARSDPPLALPEDFAATAIHTEPFRVDRLVVFRSFLARPAPRYEPLGVHPFGMLASEHVFE